LAQVCSRESRWNILSPCLIQLLQDQSRWVKTAALRVLGYFISTFARSDDQQEEEETKNNDEQINDLSLKVEQNVKIDDNDKFNDFNYWREPIVTNIDLDEDIIRNSNDCNLIFFEIFLRIKFI
jgi:hypothetical protein